MASGLIGIQVPRKGLWVRVPCPPLVSWRSPLGYRQDVATLGFLAVSIGFAKDATA